MPRSAGVRRNQRLTPPGVDPIPATPATRSAANRTTVNNTPGAIVMRSPGSGSTVSTSTLQYPSGHVQIPFAYYNPLTSQQPHDLRQNGYNTDTLPFCYTS